MVTLTVMITPKNATTMRNMWRPVNLNSPSGTSVIVKATFRDCGT